MCRFVKFKMYIDKKLSEIPILSSKTTAIFANTHSKLQKIVILLLMEAYEAGLKTGIVLNWSQTTSIYILDIAKKDKI
jgi:hypothetical protein